MRLNDFMLIVFALSLFSCAKKNRSHIKTELITVYNQSAVRTNITTVISHVNFVIAIHNTSENKLNVLENSLALGRKTSNVTTYKDRNFSLVIDSNKIDTIEVLVRFDTLSKKEYEYIINDDFSIVFNYLLWPKINDTLEYESPFSTFKNVYDFKKLPKVILQELRNE